MKKILAYILLIPCFLGVFYFSLGTFVGIMNENCRGKPITKIERVLLPAFYGCEVGKKIVTLLED